jgi:ABC-type antimicrobial peptide transport system permease subunit
MWSSWVKEKGTTHVMYIAKLKDGPKRVKKTFSMILERVSQMVWWRGRKWNHIEKDFLKLNCFSPLKILTSPLFEESLGAFLSHPHFFIFFSLPFFLYFVSWGLGGFDDIWGGNHFIKILFSNGFNILAVDAYSRMELCMPTWLNHDYGDGGVVDILAVDAYFRVDLWTPIFLVRLANNVGSKSFSKCFQNSNGHIP